MYIAKTTALFDYIFILVRQIHHFHHDVHEICDQSDLAILKIFLVLKVIENQLYKQRGIFAQLKCVRHVKETNRIVKPQQGNYTYFFLSFGIVWLFKELHVSRYVHLSVKYIE